MEDNIATLNHTDSSFTRQYIDALNWVSSEVDPSQLKIEFVNYCATIDKADIAATVPVNYIGVEGSIAYCLNRGAILSQKSHDRIAALVQKYATTDAVHIELEWEEIPSTVQTRAILAYVNCYSLIDNAKTRVLAGKLPIKELSSTVRKIIQDNNLGKNAVTRRLLKHYSQSLQEARADAIVKDWVKPITVILDTINLMLGNKASVKSSAKKAMDRKMNSTAAQTDRVGEKAATKIAYLQEDVDLGIKSVNPTNIVGAQTVVIFNTKTRHCEVYFAKEGEKLSIKGSKITNFNETTSIGKNMRKPEESLQRWVAATTTKRVQVLLQSVNGKNWELTGKLNSNSLILKVL
jgi:hypothetical protein